jgi:hypothetical protein
MNAARGLRRLWVVGSIAWTIGFTAWLAYDIATRATEMNAEAEQSAAAACGRATAEDHLCFGVKRYEYLERNDTLGRRIGRLAAEHDFFVPLFFAFLLGPPLLVYVLGLVAAWIGRGFAAERRP